MAKHFLLLVYLLAAALSKGQDSLPNRSLSAVKATGVITIDGYLQEDDWKAAQPANSFWINYPSDNKKAGPATEVKVLFNDESLYIGAEIRGGKKPVIQTLKRDAPFEESDAFAVIIDPTALKSLGYIFGVNAAGAPSEAIISAAQGAFVEPVDYSWDAKWFSAVSKTADGWTVEMHIPLKILRFKNNSNEWRINFLRIDRGNNEQHVWNHVPVQFMPTDLGFTGTMRWEQAPVARKFNISFTPYTLARYVNDPALATNETKASFGGDARISITPTLNADLTVNPDFSQSEVDQQVTNLTRFSVFFPEKRQFFLENADIFTNFNSFPDAPFFSRRIGLDRSGNTVPISYGARITGNLDPSTRIGLLNMQTKNDTNNISVNYSTVAVHRRIFKRSTIRGLFLNKTEFDDGRVKKDTYSRNASLEFEYLSLDGKWNGKLSQNFTFIPGNPKDKNFSIASIGYNGRKFQSFTEFQDMGSNYRADMGFLSRLYQYDPISNKEYAVGYRKLTNMTDYNIYPTGKNIIRHWIGSENYLWWVKQGILNEWYIRMRYFVFFRNTSAIKFRFNNNYVDLLYPFYLTDGLPLPADKYHFRELNIEYNSDTRKKISTVIFAVYGSFYNGYKYTLSSDISYRVRPWGSFIMGFELNDIRLPDPYSDSKFLLIYPKVQIDFSKKIYWTTFMQYNKQTSNFNINSRLQWRYRPMSDLFLIVTNNYQTENRFARRNESVILKLNYYFQP